MGEFGATLMLVGVTRMKTETLPGSIYLSISTGNNDVAMATAMIMLIVSAATLVLANLLNRPVGASRIGGDGRGGDDTRVYYTYSVTHRTDDAPRPRHRGYRNPQSLRNERRREPREWS